MSRHNRNRYRYTSTRVSNPNGDKLFKVSTSPQDSNGEFAATFTGLLNYDGGGTVSGIWDFGDGQVMEYKSDEPFTHHGYNVDQQYTVKLSITKSYHRNADQPNEKTDQYFMVKTLEIGAAGVQRNATFNQSSQLG